MNSTTSVPVADIVAALKVRYPAAVCALDWGGQHDSDPETRRRNGWRLLVMARLSAQCTDARVNQVCRELFRLYPTPGALAAAPQAENHLCYYTRFSLRVQVNDSVPQHRSANKRKKGRADFMPPFPNQILFYQIICLETSNCCTVWERCSRTYLP